MLEQATGGGGEGWRYRLISACLIPRGLSSVYLSVCISVGGAARVKYLMRWPFPMGLFGTLTGEEITPILGEKVDTSQYVTCPDNKGKRWGRKGDGIAPSRITSDQN